MRIERTSTAEEDLIGIWCFVAAHNEAAADRLLDRLELRWAALASYPLLGRSCAELGEGVRCLVEADYLIFYRVSHNSVDILRVLHGRRDISADDVAP